MIDKEIKRGDIFWVKFEPTRGNETNGKKRPVIVVSNEKQNRKGKRVIILPLSSKVEKIYRFELLLETEITSNKLSKIMVDQIRALDKEKLLTKIGKISEREKDMMEEKLITLLALENKIRFFLLWKKYE